MTAFSALVYLLSFRVGFTLAEVFVVIGQTIHEQSEKADEARAHWIEPLRGMHEKHGGTEEAGGTGYTDSGVEPSDHGFGIESE